MSDEKGQGFRLIYNGEERVYGNHSYQDEQGIGYGSCVHKCGCINEGGDGYSAGPVGIDIDGACPGNRLDAKTELGSIGLECDFIITARIQMAERRVGVASDAVRQLKGLLMSWSAEF